MNRSILSRIILNNFGVLQRGIKIFNINFQAFDIIVTMANNSKGRGCFLWIGNANTQKYGVAQSLDYVPESNPDNILILLYICSANLKFICPILAKI